MTLEKAKALLEAATYLAISHEYTSAVTRWVFSDRQHFNVEPAYFELHKLRRGRLLPTKGACEAGFDAQDALRVQRQWGQESFYRHSLESIERYQFERGQLMNASWFAKDAGRIEKIYTAYQNNTALITQFFYEGARLVRVQRSGPGVEDVRDLEHEGDQIVRTYWRLANGGRQIDFERSSKERSLSALADAISKGMREALLGLANVIALCYCDADRKHRLPPHIAITDLPSLLRLKRRFGDLNSVWNPAEWPASPSPVLPPALLALCEQANQDIWQNELFEEADALLKNIALDLGPERIVFCTNLDDFSAARDVRAFISEQMHYRLTMLGLLAGTPRAH